MLGSSTGGNRFPTRLPFVRYRTSPQGNVASMANTFSTQIESNA